MRTPTVDCLVVGAGPAGLTAALYLRRFQRSVAVLDGGHSRALAIEHSHNYPAFPQGISGRQLLLLLRQQLAQVGWELVASEVKNLQRLASGLFAATGGGRTWLAQTVLLATGVVDAVPGVPGIEQVRERGLLRQCPICDGYEHRGKRILVLGDGLHAAREADFIADYSPHVARAGLNKVPPAARPSVRVLAALATRVDLPPYGGLCLTLADGSTHDFDVAYAAVGVQPCSQLGRALGAELDGHGCLLTDTHGATCVDGLYAAGDVASGLDQLVIATSQGAIAATAIHNRLRPESL